MAAQGSAATLLSEATRVRLLVSPTLVGGVGNLRHCYASGPAIAGGAPPPLAAPPLPVRCQPLLAVPAAG